MSITFGLADKPDLGDTLLLTPVFKNCPNSTIEFSKTERGYYLSKLFYGIANIKYVDNPLSETEYFEKYGKIENKQPLIHACKNYCNIFNIKTKDHIPYVFITETEKEMAKNFLLNFKNPIIICPIAGGFNNNDSKALSKMISNNLWNELTERLSKKHDILYFSGKNTKFPIKNTIELFGLEIRDMLALFNICKKVISIENGLLHAAIASGATVNAIIPGFEWNYGYYFPNYGYTEEMWINQEKRAFYYKFEDYLKILENYE